MMMYSCFSYLLEMVCQVSKPDWHQLKIDPFCINVESQGTKVWKKHLRAAVWAEPDDVLESHELLPCTTVAQSGMLEAA